MTALAISRSSLAAIANLAVPVLGMTGGFALGLDVAVRDVGVGGGLRLKWSCAAVAQTVPIVPDETLPQPSIAVELEDGIEIRGGTASGPNLFHSFERFDLDNGDRATFITTPAIDRVLARVTGGDLARINGTLAADADLVLLAPSGIHFGDRAGLDVSGAFVATTASAIEFADGVSWPAIAAGTTQPPLLSIAVPLGLTFDAAHTPATISAVGGERASTFDTTGLFGGLSFEAIEAGAIVEFAETLLASAPGQTLALVGGNIDLQRTQFYTPGGQIVLAAIRDGQFDLTSLKSFATGFDAGQLGLDRAELGGEISLSDGASLLADGAPGGTIAMAAETISLVRDGFVMLNNFGDRAGGSFTAVASDLMSIDGTPQTGAGSEILTHAFGRGAGGNLTLSVGRLEMIDGAALQTVSYGLGDSGELAIEARDRVSLVGFDPTTLDAGSITNISSTTRISGQGGDIRLQSRQLELREGGTLLGLTAGSGAGGSLDVAVSESVLVEGSANGTQGSTLATGTFAFGRAGDVRIQTPSLTMRDGGRLGSTTVAFGDAGDVTIESASAIELSGRDAVLGGSRIFALSASSRTSELVPPDLLVSLPELAETIPTGNAGTISIATPDLHLLDGGALLVGSRGFGNPGRLSVTGEQLRMETGSVISAETVFGSGGDVRLDLDVLDIDNSLILTTTAATGRGGDIFIRARDRLEIIGQPLVDEQVQGLIQLTGGVTTLPDLALGIVSGSFGSGDAGDITVEAGSLTLRDGGLIAPATLGSGNAGRAIVRVTGDALLDGGLISTATIGQQEDAGQSGPLFFEAENLTIRAGGSLATTTLGPGNAGQLHLNVRDRLLLSDRSDPNLPSGGNLSTGTLRVTDATSGNGGDIFVRAGTVLLDDGARISSSSEALGNAGSITVETARLLLSDDASIAATSLSGRGGNISLYSDDLAVLRNGSQITTRAGLAETGGGDGGNLSIRTDLFAAIEASQLSANAFSGTGGNISIAARSLFLGPRSPIDASSQLGIDGSVELSSETIDVDFDIEDLPSDLLENAVLESGCAGGSRNRFTFAGRGHRFGVFSHAVETSPTWHDDRDWRTIGTAGDPLQDSPLTPTISRPVRPVFETPSQTLEASRWESEPNGSVRLISSETSQRARPHLPGCADVNAG